MMSTYSDDLDASLVRLVIWLRTLKGWQKAMVDVDGVLSMPFTEVLAEDLHVSAQCRWQLAHCMHYSQEMPCSMNTAFFVHSQQENGAVTQLGQVGKSRTEGGKRTARSHGT